MSRLEWQLTKLKEKFGTWPEFEEKTKIHRTQIVRILDRGITMTPDMAERLSPFGRHSAKGWMLMWVDHYYRPKL